MYDVHLNVYGIQFLHEHIIMSVCIGFGERSPMHLHLERSIDRNLIRALYTLYKNLIAMLKIRCETQKQNWIGSRRVTCGRKSFWNGDKINWRYVIILLGILYYIYDHCPDHFINTDLGLSVWRIISKYKIYINNWNTTEIETIFSFVFVTNGSQKLYNNIYYSCVVWCTYIRCTICKAATCIGNIAALGSSNRMLTLGNKLDYFDFLFRTLPELKRCLKNYDNL